ncbi:MAG TPA: MFS transporter [Anaerolineales bacterium]|nr:MFS transporter [Anaerolineales bacterium]
MFRDWHVLFTFNRNIRLFLTAWALLAFAYFGIQGVLFNLYLLRLGFDTQFIGSLIASGQIVWALAALPAGMIGQRIGLRGALITGNILSMLGNAFLLMVEWLPGNALTAGLYFSWILAWLGAALIAVNSIPYLLQVSTAGERNHAFVAQGAVIAIMGFLGSVVAGFLPDIFATWLGSSLDQPAPYWYPLCLVPIAYLAGAIAWIKAEPVNLIKDSEPLEIAPIPMGLFVFLGLVVSLQTAGEGSVRAFFNVYLDKALQMPAAQIGVIFGVGQLLPVFISLIIPSIFARWGIPRVLAISSAGAGLVSLPLAIFQHWIPATFGFVGLLCMLAINAPARNLFSQEIVKPRWRTTTSAIATGGIGLGWASTALAGGYLIPRIGFSGLFWIGALLAFVAAILLWGFNRSHSGHKA